MKIVFMGTPEIAAKVLKSLIDSGRHEIAAVVTQPDKPKGRGHEMAFSEVKETALKEGIRVLQPEKASDPAFLDEIRNIAPDVICVAAYGKILRPVLLDMPRFGCINVHASLLPKYRGAAPIQWAVLNGEEKSGVTIMHMAAGLDTGDMIIKEEVPLSKDETAGSLHDKLADIGGPLLLKALDLIEKGEAPRIPQDESQATYVSTIDKSFGNVDFSEPAEKLERFLRGLDPWPSAFTKLNGKNLKLFKGEVKEAGSLPEEYKNAVPGTVVSVSQDSFDILCGEGIISIKQLQLEGKKRMDTADFLRGYVITPGTVLGE